MPTIRYRPTQSHLAASKLSDHSVLRHASRRKEEQRPAGGHGEGLLREHHRARIQLLGCRREINVTCVACTADGSSISKFASRSIRARETALGVRHPGRLRRRRRHPPLVHHRLDRLAGRGEDRDVLAAGDQPPLPRDNRLQEEQVRRHRAGQGRLRQLPDVVRAVRLRRRRSEAVR